MIKPAFKIIIKLNMYVKCIAVFNNRKEKRSEIAITNRVGSKQDLLRK